MATLMKAILKSAIEPSATPMDPEVVAIARRRQFSPSEKRRILAAADRCTQPGELGALLRREGVYSSSLSTWRRQRDAAETAALAPPNAGPQGRPDPCGAFPHRPARARGGAPQAPAGFGPTLGPRF